MPAFVKPPSNGRPKLHPIDVSIGLKIQRRRLQRGLTIEDLAKKLNTTKQTISGYEQGRLHVTIVRIFLIAHILDVPVSWFFEGVEVGDDFDA